VRAALARHDLAGVAVRLVPTPDRYVASEESALVRMLSGGPALPTSRPPRPAARGVRGAPTLVLNAETLADLALAVHSGPEAYRSVGDPAEPGTLLVTVALGPGMLAVLPRHACGPAETAAVARYLAGQSAGQCGPCVFGLPDIAGALEAAVAGGPRAGAALGAVRRWTATLPGSGACRHPDGAARLVASALRVFAADLSAHVAGRPCGAYYGPCYLEVPL